MMTAKEAAEIIKGIEEVRGALPEDGLLVEEALSMAVKALEAQEWIPCSERLPKDDEIVLVSNGIDCAVAFWRSDADAWDDPIHGWLDNYGFEVKAWMPLPEPYRKEGEQHE